MIVAQLWNFQGFFWVDPMLSPFFIGFPKGRGNLEGEVRQLGIHWGIIENQDWPTAPGSTAPWWNCWKMMGTVRLLGVFGHKHLFKAMFGKKLHPCRRSYLLRILFRYVFWGPNTKNHLEVAVWTHRVQSGMIFVGWPLPCFWTPTSPIVGLVTNIAIADVEQGVRFSQKTFPKRSTAEAHIT